MNVFTKFLTKKYCIDDRFFIDLQSIERKEFLVRYGAIGVTFSRSMNMKKQWKTRLDWILVLKISFFRQKNFVKILNS